MTMLDNEWSQTTFEDITADLVETTFVVVDLETTGGSAQCDAITEFGAVKVRGGDVLGEFQTLVNPGLAIPPLIAVLTGITDSMVAPAPTIEVALPSFLEFAHGSTLVAHNAPFDVGFLKAACRGLGIDWPGFAVIDTARLARRLVHRDEAPNCKLATLATLFHTQTTPNHRALQDARATVDVLHALIGRLGNSGVRSVDDLAEWQRAVAPQQRDKRSLATDVPAAPGVYSFVDARGERLYVGKSVNMRSRVRTYFTASEKRRRMVEMVGLAARVESLRCATPLEAEIRELRLIAGDKPRYNRRSKHPERATWIKLTADRFPRLSLVRTVRDDGCSYLGPFASRRAAEAAVDAVHQAIPLRQCSQRISVDQRSPACALLDLGRCTGPCQGLVDEAVYARHVEAARVAMTTDPEALHSVLRTRIDQLAQDERFEEAAAARDRLGAFLRAAARYQQVTSLARIPHLVAAARPAGRPGQPLPSWEIHVVRYGRLAAAGVAHRGEDPVRVAASLSDTAEHVDPGTGGLPAADWEEAEIVLRWLHGARLMHVTGEWTLPVRGAARLAVVWRAAGAASATLSALHDGPSTAPQPLATLMAHKSGGAAR